MLAPPAWLVLEASVIAEAADARQTLAAIPTVLFSTSFGRVLIAQVLALLAAILAMRVQQPPQSRLATVGFAGLATVLEAGHSHAFAMEDGPSLLLISQSVHLLAAGAWLGGLAPLLIVVTWWPKRCGALPIPLLSRLPPRARHARGRVAVTGVNHAFTKLYFAPGSYGKLFFADVSVDREESPRFLAFWRVTRRRSLIAIGGLSPSAPPSRKRRKAWAGAMLRPIFFSCLCSPRRF